LENTNSEAKEISLYSQEKFLSEVLFTDLFLYHCHRVMKASSSDCRKKSEVKRCFNTTDSHGSIINKKKKNTK